MFNKKKKEEQRREELDKRYLAALEANEKTPNCMRCKWFVKRVYIFKDTQCFCSAQGMNKLPSASVYRSTECNRVYEPKAGQLS